MGMSILLRVEAEGGAAVPAARRDRQLLVVGEQVGAEVFGQSHVDRVGEGDVRPAPPGVGQQTPDLHDAQRPGHQCDHGCADDLRREDRVEVPAAEDCATFDIEQLGDSWDGISR